MLLHFCDDTCLIFCQFLNICFIGYYRIKARIVKGLKMDCFDTILAYTNMHTFFVRNFKVRIFLKYISEIHVYAKLRLQCLYVPVLVNL